MQQKVKYSVNLVTQSGLVKTLPKNIASDANKIWYALSILQTDRLMDGQPSYQTLNVNVFNPNNIDLVGSLNEGDEILIVGKLSVRNVKDQQGNWRTDVKLINGLNQPITLLSTGNALPQPPAQQNAPRQNSGYNQQRGQNNNQRNNNPNGYGQQNPQQNRGYAAQQASVDDDSLPF